MIRIGSERPPARRRWSLRHTKDGRINGGRPRPPAAPGRTVEAAATAVVPDLIQALLRVYAARNEEEEKEVRRFLTAHPELLALLVEAPTRIPNIVADGRALGIEVLLDPEDHDAEGDLFVTVPTHGRPDQIEPWMETFRRGWLLEATLRSRGRFNVAARYVRATSPGRTTSRWRNGSTAVPRTRPPAGRPSAGPPTPPITPPRRLSAATASLPPGKRAKGFGRR